MIFGFVMLAVAVTISLVAAYYSIMGLTAIFAAAVVPIIIMGGALELGKVIATVWLHNNWKRVPYLFKVYLVPAVAFLMFLTSMGIFGFLSKAHSDQTLVSGDVVAKVSIYDEKIKTEKENIEANRKALKQMDEAVDQVMGRSTDEKGADKSVALRRSQQKERGRLQAEISQSQKSIAELNEARAPIAAEVRKVEAEVGPIKYIAALVYGDNLDANLLEKAVRWVIILIVMVFDPLALTLILAANKQFEWALHGQGGWVHDDDNLKPIDFRTKVTEPVTNFKNWLTDAFPRKKQEPVPEAPAYKVVEDADDEPSLEEINQELAEAVEQQDPESIVIPEEPVIVDNTALQELANDYAKLEEQNNKSLERSLALQMQVEELTQQLEQARTPNPMSMTERPGDYVEPPALEVIPDSNYLKHDGKVYSKEAFATNFPDLALHADNAIKEATSSRASFGTEFPAEPSKGDLFLRVDTLPSRLYKWNGTKWLEIDKNTTDTYAYNEEYIKHLIAQVEAGSYDADDLSDTEREQIAEYLRKNAQ